MAKEEKRGKRLRFNFYKVLTHEEVFLIKRTVIEGIQRVGCYAGTPSRKELTRQTQSSQKPKALDSTIFGFNKVGLGHFVTAGHGSPKASFSTQSVGNKFLFCS